MLKKLFLLMMLACVAAYCQVKPGENLCVNGMLEADQEPMPPFWNYANAKYISYNPNGGPNSTGCLIFENTTTIGIRYSLKDRFVLDRREETVTTKYGDVKIKISEGYGVKKVKPGYDDVAGITSNGK